jgi:membrane protease subunit (stomatin/prohibitin family)
MVMSIFKKKHSGGAADVIRCDETDYLIWKWHPDKYDEGNLKRETAIRTNSVLRVKNGEVAVFVYKQKNGENEDYIVGPHDETIKTKNFPILSSIIGLWYEGDTPFQAEIFFINIAKVVQIKFGVPYFDVVDPRYTDFQVPVAVRGTMTFRIEDYKEFVKCHQLATFDFDKFKKQVIDSLCRYAKDAVTNAASENNIPVISIESKIDLINEKMEMNVKNRMSEVFGITVTGVDINSIEIEKDSTGYLELKRITKDITTKQVEINLKNYEEQLRIQREEQQYAQHMATRTTNIGAYETEVKGEVGVASAEALGKMGENGAGNISMGSGDSAGFNPMTIMAGLAVGGVVAKNIGATLDQSMNATGTVPPSIPQVVYYVAVDNNPVGPFDLNKIKEKIANGEIVKETLLWKQGTPTWEKASSFAKLSSLFPPSIPK